MVIASDPRLTEAGHADAGTETSFVVEAVTEAFFQSADYAALHARSNSSAFQHPLWLQAFHRHLAPSRGAQGVTLVGRPGPDEPPCFVLPMITRKLSGVTILESADLGVSDYAAPVVDLDWWELLHDQPALRESVAAALPSHDILRVKPIRDEHLALWQALLPGSTKTLGFSAHATSLVASLEHWREQALTDSFGRYLARKRKRFFKTEGARLVVVQGENAIACAMERLVQLREGRFEQDVIAAPAAQAFYSAVAQSGEQAGFARVYALELGGEAIGYTFCLAFGGRLHYLLIGCDYQAHGRHSPGLLLYDGMIGDWIDAGGEIFDFTIGDEPFKADFGTVATPLHVLTHTPTVRGALALAAMRWRERWREASATTTTTPFARHQPSGEDNG
jgi:CelD/BcsL family acetyltransferase involved in cellulose biosynthesis